MYKTCPALGINSNSERCLNEIDTRVPKSMNSVYEARSHACKRGFARETAHDVSKPEENCKGMAMGSVYEATSHESNRGFARETPPDVCKPEENCKSMPMGSVYEATSHVNNMGFARETPPDVCKPEENCQGMSSHHSVGAVNTKSVNNR